MQIYHETNKELNYIMCSTSIKTKAQVFKSAIAILKDIIKEIGNGNKVVIANEKGHIIKRLVVPQWWELR